MEWLGGKLDRVKITWQKSLAGLGAAQRIDSSYSDERNDLTGKISGHAKFEFQIREKISNRKQNWQTGSHSLDDKLIENLKMFC